MNIESRWAEIAHFANGLEAKMHQRVDGLLEQNKTVTTVYVSATYSEKGITEFEVELHPTVTAKWAVTPPRGVNNLCSSHVWHTLTFDKQFREEMTKQSEGVLQ